VTAAAIAIDAGDLPLGGGLLALVRPALDRLEPGGILAILSDASTVREDLPAWCRVERHGYLGVFSEGGRDRHLIERGRLGVPRPTSEDPPDRADPLTGPAPRGARVEPGGPAWPFTLVDEDHVGPPEAAAIYAQGVAAQWDARNDIPWADLPMLDPLIERTVGQIMGFLAENELAALYVPAGFVSRVHPAYVETAQVLAIQMADEARHIEVFLARARARGAGAGVSAAATSWSLLGLLEATDFTEAEFLLSVLGEGTFLDLLGFVEEHAPDPVTREIARRTRIDEARHVRFGLAHVRHALGRDETLFPRLEAAVRRRASRLAGVGGVPAPLQDALTVLAAGSTAPSAIRRGHDAFRALLDTMHLARRKRLSYAGFDEEQAERISALHTPNFM
jgi:TusA-related sulfurtransferase